MVSLLQTTNRKCGLELLPPVTFSDLDSYSPVASLFKCNVSCSCVAANKILADIVYHTVSMWYLKVLLVIAIFCCGYVVIVYCSFVFF